MNDKVLEGVETFNTPKRLLGEIFGLQVIEIPMLQVIGVIDPVTLKGIVFNVKESSFFLSKRFKTPQDTEYFENIKTFVNMSSVDVIVGD